MATLFPVHTFEGFGATAARPADFAPNLGRVKSRRPMKLRAAVRELAPKMPGVYGMLGKAGDLVYVGKAKSLRARLMSYFRDSSDPKAGRILRHTHALVWETAPDEFGALVRELELIRRHRPRFNVLGQPGRQRYCYVALGRAPAAYAYVTRTPVAKDLALYGPFTSAGQAGEAVRRLNDWYRLRDCSQTVTMHFADQKELFPVERTPKCLRFDIGTCTGPCAGGCSRTGYGTQVRAAKRFLDGDDDRPLTDLAAKMLVASAGTEFERAAAFRDRLESLQWLTDKLNWLRRARRENTFVYPLVGPDGRTVWYLVHRGRILGACYRPAGVRSARRAMQLLEDVYATDPGPVLTTGPVDHVLLVSGWFRKNADEKAACIAPDEARACAAGVTGRRRETAA